MVHAHFTVPSKIIRKSPVKSFYTLLCRSADNPIKMPVIKGCSDRSEAFTRATAITPDRSSRVEEDTVTYSEPYETEETLVTGTSYHEGRKYINHSPVFWEKEDYEFIRAIIPAKHYEPSRERRCSESEQVQKQLARVLSATEMSDFEEPFRSYIQDNETTQLISVNKALKEGQTVLITPDGEHVLEERTQSPHRKVNKKLRFKIGDTMSRLDEGQEGDSIYMPAKEDRIIEDISCDLNDTVRRQISHLFKEHNGAGQHLVLEEEKETDKDEIGRLEELHHKGDTVTEISLSKEADKMRRLEESSRKEDGDTEHRRDKVTEIPCVADGDKTMQDKGLTDIRDMKGEPSDMVCQQMSSTIRRERAILGQLSDTVCRQISVIRKGDGTKKQAVPMTTCPMETTKKKKFSLSNLFGCCKGRSAK